MVKSFEKREEKQQKRNRMILGILITIIMIGSTLGYFVGNEDNNGGLDYTSIDGETYTFQSINGKLYTKIDDKQMSFYTHPNDASRINVTSGVDSLIIDSQFFFMTFDPVENNDIQFIEQARFDLEKDFIEKKRYVFTGVKNNSSGYENFNVISCANASADVPVIEFVSTNESYSRAYVSDSCIIFEGRRYDFLRFRDYIVYKMYGVI